MLERLLERTALYSRRHYRRVFVAVGILLVLSLAAASRLRFDTEILNLLPADDPVVQQFRETLKQFGSLDVLLVVVRLPERTVLTPYLDFVDRLGPRIEALDEMEYIDYRIGTVDELVEEFFPNAFLFLDEEGLQQVAERLSQEAVEARAVELRSALRTPQSVALADLLRLDPLGVSDVFVDQLTSTRGDLKVDWSSGYVLSKNKQMLLMVGKPTEPAQEVEFGRRLVSAVNGVVEETLAEWDDIAAADGDTALEKPVVELGGTYVTALEDAGTLVTDIVTNAVTSMIGVLVLFTIAFRRLGLVLYAFVPLTCGLVLSFGFAGMTVGVLNAATSGFAALLVGLGIDFVIVSYGRYVEERNRGARLSTALRQMSGSSGRAVITGGITTSATFMAFTITKFTGLRQLGFLIGVGILFCMLSVLVVLPAMLAWREDRKKGGLRAALQKLPGMRRRSQSASEIDHRPRLHLQSFGSEHLIRWCYQNPMPVLVMGLVVTAGALVLATQIEFVDSIRNMRPEGNKGMMLQDEVADQFGSGFDYMMLVVTGDNEEDVLERTATVAEEARQLVDDGTLNGVASIGDIIPAPSRQLRALEWLENNRELLDREQLLPRFETAARSAGLNPAAFRRGFDLLQEAASVEEPVRISTLGGRDETRRLLERYVREKDGIWRSVVFLYPPPLVWKRSAPPGVSELAERMGPDVVLSGVNTVSERLRDQVKNDAIVAATVGAVVVALLLFADYRRIGDTLLSLAPLGVGIIWMLGGMRVLGVNMNFFNVFVTTMVIGIGVDYGVHMIHRYREQVGRPDLVEGLSETGKAIVLAALSTSVGFGSMSLSRYPGLRSMGMVAIMGAVATALVAVTLLPAVLSLTDRRRARSALLAPSKSTVTVD